MNTRSKSALLFSLTALAACAGCLSAPEAPAESDVSVDAVSAIVIDTTTLTDAPPASIPSDRITRLAFSEGMVARALLGTAETFAPLSTLGARVAQASPTWHLERNAATGELLALRHAAPGAAVPQDERRLQLATASLLDRWGLHAGEIHRVLVRRLMSQDEEGSVLSPAAVFRHKVFVFRGINAVPIQGHRAVVTWAPDGNLQRVYTRWPALAATGHRLSTALTRAQIQARALAAITAAGVTSGAAQLRWKYLPTPTPAGDVTLTLAVSARFTSAAVSADGDEAREIDVDVSATP